MFLKADRALSKLNFLFHLKSKTNLVTLKKCNSHLQYYKVDLSFIIKIQEINLNVCKEYKTELIRVAQEKRCFYELIKKILYSLRAYY